MNKPLFISLVPNLRDYSGHDFAYNESLGNSLEILKWKHVAAIPRDCTISNLPKAWEACLFSLNSKGKISFKEKALFPLNFIRSLRDFFKRVPISSNKNIIIFLESFSARHLIYLFLSIFFRNKKFLQIWLLYRFEPYRYALNGRFYYFINKAFKFLLKRNSLKILTDSEKLKPELEKVFNERVHPVPIPHTHFIPEPVKKNKSGTITCWWPGPPRVNKGLEKVKELVAQCNLNGNYIIFRLAQSSQIESNPIGIEVELLKDSLSMEEYNQALVSSDFIILPYDPYYYHSSTSGIFVETIFVGKIPIVSENTWMAYELEKYNLNELIFNWNVKEFPQLIENLYGNTIIKNKISIMQDYYKGFHNESSFATVLANIYSN